MPLTPVAPPQPVPIIGAFDYVAIDAERRRVYAAHTGSQALLIVNADSGQVLGQVRVGPLHGVAVDPVTGHVFTGDGEARTVSEVDPVAMKVMGSADVDGKVDAIAYDPVLHRVYADEDDGTHLFVVDTTTMKQTAVVALPGHKPEFLAVDPKTHRLYQNIANLNEFVIVDPKTLMVSATVKTPDVDYNHPLQLDPGLGHVYVAGRNGVLATYDLGGTRLSTTKFQGGFDQCSVDTTRHNLVCAGGGGLTVFHDDGTAVSIVGTQSIAKGVHTTAVDEHTGDFWAVWTSEAGDFVQAFKLAS
jgi:DNA-binding beta-propeller fold protein YncE